MHFYSTSNPLAEIGASLAPFGRQAAPLLFQKQSALQTQKIGQISLKIVIFLLD
jgi:hypothetical protein